MGSVSRKESVYRKGVAIYTDEEKESFNDKRLKRKFKTKPPRRQPESKRKEVRNHLGRYVLKAELLEEDDECGSPRLKQTPWTLRGTRVYQGLGDASKGVKWILKQLEEKFNESAADLDEAKVIF